MTERDFDKEIEEIKNGNYADWERKTMIKIRKWEKNLSEIGKCVLEAHDIINKR